jgi:hypothetical protein
MAPLPRAVPPVVTPDSDAALARRRRGRNIATLIVLVALAALFYAIAMVKMAQVGHLPS